MPVMTTCYVLETWIEEDRDWHRIDSRAASFEDLSQACDRARKRREEVGIIPIIRRRNNALFSPQAIASN